MRKPATCLKRALMTHLLLASRRRRSEDMLWWDEAKLSAQQCCRSCSTARRDEKRREKNFHWEENRNALGNSLPLNETCIWRQFDFDTNKNAFGRFPNSFHVWISLQYHRGIEHTFPQNIYFPIQARITVFGMQLRWSSWKVLSVFDRCEMHESLLF